MSDSARSSDPNELDPIETADREEIAALQLARLRATLRHACDNVAHYRSRFEDAGLTPADFESIEDLANFLFTVKEDLRRNYPFGMFSVPLEQVIRVHASSGTTGKPTVVRYTRNDLDMWSDVVARSMRAAGVRSGDMVQITYGYGLFTGGLGFHGSAERLGCTVVPVSGGMTERQVQLIDEFKPRMIAVTPSYMLAIADEFARQGLDPRQCSLQIDMFGAEPWTGAMRNEIEAGFDMQALDVYGLSEVIGPGVSAECAESKDGLHIWEDHFYPEIIDPATGEVLRDGEMGEFVLTSLTKEACPVIRYRTGDLTRLMPGTSRSMRRMQKVTGRCDDMLIIRGVNLFPTQIEEILLRDERLSPHYCLEVRRSGRLDELTVIVEARAGAADKETRETAGRDLARHIKSQIGISSDVEVREPESLERSIGKARRIVDLRPKA